MSTIVQIGDSGEKKTQKRKIVDIPLQIKGIKKKIVNKLG